MMKNPKPTRIPRPQAPTAGKTAPLLRLMAFIAVVWITAVSARAQQYSVGQVVTNFSLINRANGQPVQLTDFVGKIIVLDWFAWWCPYCQAAAPQLLAGIDQHYTPRGGNPDGIPVVHIGVNLQPNQEVQTQNFVTQAGLDLVLNDFSRAVANRFASGGQPIFAVINGVTNSPTHKPWELLYSQPGYGQTTFPINLFQSAIDAVKTASLPSRVAGFRLRNAETLDLTLEVQQGKPYRIESSTNLVHWSSVISLTATNSNHVVQLQNSAGQERRFFRAVNE
jgi:thiol-disulfide isomerase/thioredoxin